jgi:putative ABC transport system ATP-binding protein
MEISEGEYVAIVGSSGSGKSTLLNILGCLDRPSRGSYMFDEQNVSRLSDTELSQIRLRHIGFVFQSYQLIPQLTAMENIELPLFYRGIAPAVRKERSRELARRLDIEKQLRHRPAEMSGGQQQRTAIARALINDPRIILADEPTGNLDSRTEEEILHIFDELFRQGRTLVVVTHDETVYRHAKRVVRIEDGRIRL